MLTIPVDVLIETLWNVKFFVDLWGETEGEY